MLTIRPLMTAASSICCPPKQCRFRARHSNRPWLHNSNKRAPNPLSVGKTRENAGTPQPCTPNMPYSPWPSQPLTCAMQHMSSNTIKLLLEKFQVCPNDVHTWLDLHRRLRNKTHQHPKIRNSKGLVVKDRAARTAATLPDPRENKMVKGYSQNSLEHTLLAP